MIEKHDACPNCGAAITNEKCPYCGTLFYDFAAMELDKPFYIKFRNGSKVCRAKVLLDSLNLRHDMDRGYMYADNLMYSVAMPQTSHLTLELSILQDNGILAMIVDTDEISPDYKAW